MKTPLFRPAVWLLALVLFPAGAAAQQGGDSEYFPAAGEWERRAPQEAGFDPDLLADAVRFAIENETPWPTDVTAQLEQSLASGPHGEIVGPVKDRGGPAGVIVRDGYIVAEWGDLDRVDMTFSVTKSYLATTAGLALDRELIESVHDPVVSDAPQGFQGPRNSRITWHMLLTQTSEWEGELWGKPDVADRREGRDRELHEPGTFWEYNDVRVNATAYALLQVWDRALPQVLDSLVMDPIGASDTWEWHGYRTSWVEIDGDSVQSVSGGGHWGGGLWINTLDHARFGLLHLRDGIWDGQRILSEDWIRAATTPTPIRPVYGYMWWLNTDRELFPSAPASSYFALGAGTNLIWVDPEHELVAVVRWIDNRQVDGFIQRVLAALGSEAAAAAPETSAPVGVAR